MYIYHALINALCAHMIHINLNMVLYTHVEHSPTKTIYIKYYTKNNNNKQTKKKQKKYALHTLHNNNVNLSSAYQRPERSHDIY